MPATLDEAGMRAAVTARDGAYDGRFYYGVVTTGVLCRPSCPSRAARPENLRFFATLGEGLAAGLRPCRRCKPDVVAPELAPAIAAARRIEAHLDEPLTMSRLAAETGVSQGRLQRAFKAALGLTPKQFHDALRQRAFKRALRAGGRVTDAIYEAGYGSSSRAYTAARDLGMAPGAFAKGGAGERVSYAIRPTRFGRVLMAATDRGVCFVQIGDSQTEAPAPDQDDLVAALARELPAAERVAASGRAAADLDAWIEALDRHVADGAPRPDVPLDLRGTAFQHRVWRFLSGLDRGQTVSYTDVAQGIDHPKAHRAVAAACGANRVAVLVPCHRVLRADGGAGGYRWGEATKRTLLELERRAD